jgi:Leu/Phe-tRNA-protein transferase
VSQGNAVMVEVIDTDELVGGVHGKNHGCLARPIGGSASAA